MRMLRSLPGVSGKDLERELLRKGVSHRATGALCCADCGRHPLIGETVHRFGPERVCALCRPARGGQPVPIEVVHHVEHGISVRRRELPRAA